MGAAPHPSIILASPLTEACITVIPSEARNLSSLLSKLGQANGPTMGLHPEANKPLIFHLTKCTQVL